MTEGDVCPEQRKSGKVRLLKAIQPPKPPFAGRQSYSCFPHGASFASIGAEFGSHLGNIGKMLRSYRGETRWEHGVCRDSGRS